MTEKKKKAYLSEMLYVPVQDVQPEHMDAFTSTFEKVIYEKPTDVARKCVNCKFWKKAWRDSAGNENPVPSAWVQRGRLL